MNTSTAHVTDVTKQSGNLLAMRQEIINDVASSKTTFERSLNRLKKYDDFLRASNIEIPRTEPDFQTKPGSSQETTTKTNGSSNGVNGVHARSTETVVKTGRKGKRGGRKVAVASKTKNGGAKQSAKTKTGGDARKTKVRAKAGRKPGKERNGGIRAKGQGSAKASSKTPKLTLKEAMCKVIGRRIMRTEEVFEGLKQLGIVPNSQDPKRHVGYTLSSEPEIFPRVPEKGKGFYRADPSKLPARRGGRQPGSTTASSKTGGKEADSSSESASSTVKEAPKQTVNAAAAAAIDPNVEDPGERALRDLGYDPAKDPALFGKTAAG